MSDTGSPTIIHLSWGEIEVRVVGKVHRFKDCKIWPGGAQEWDWKATGTNHSRGIQVADVVELMEKGAEVIVLSRGQLNRLTVAKETREFLQDNDIPFYMEETGKAVEQFNQLSQQGKAVGGLFHTTC
jgi:hypothetical protein